MRFNIFNLFKKQKTTRYKPQYRDPMSVPNAEVELAQPQDIETTNLRHIMQAIIQKHKAAGIEVFKPVTRDEIAWFERQIGFPLPAEFKEFYSICNGFGCEEDIFNMTPIGEITNIDKEDGLTGFDFAEYMINSDSWGLRFTAEGKYEIFNGSFPAIPMTSSLEEFLTRFLKGNVFEVGGLYDWHEELGIGSD